MCTRIPAAGAIFALSVANDAAANLADFSRCVKSVRRSTLTGPSNAAATALPVVASVSAAAAAAVVVFPKGRRECRAEKKKIIYIYGIYRTKRETRKAQEKNI